jgi:hypothetical protein
LGDTPKTLGDEEIALLHAASLEHPLLDFDNYPAVVFHEFKVIEI